MTTKINDVHQKHAALVRPAYGDFGRHELGILGAPCNIIREHAERWISLLSDKWNIAYADADHKEANNGDGMGPASLVFTDKISYKRVDFKHEANAFANRILFNNQDLIFINGNHFKARKQVVIIHPDKPLDNKLAKFTDVVLILLTTGTRVPDFITSHLPDSQNIPVLGLNDEPGITHFLRDFLAGTVAPVRGLVLAGGQSTRMHTDKGSIAYHGKSQRAHMYNLLLPFCADVSISGKGESGFDVIEDTFAGLGPFGGILSAMQTDPNAAWLTVACDLPYLSAKTLEYLVQHRDPAKLATAFLDSDNKFPEPLITIWEPRAYPVMLQFLSQGYSCPRKVLINTDIKLLQAPDVSEFRNVNLPQERDEALRFFGVTD